MNNTGLEMEFGETLFYDLFEKLPAATYICDAEGRIKYFNPRAVEVWGRTPELNNDAEKFCGSFRLYHTDGTPMSHDQCWMALAIENNEEYEGREVVIERPDGSRSIGLVHARPIRDESGKLIGAVNVVLDISDRNRAEEALRESEERFRRMADNAPALMWINGPKGCEFVNRAYLEFFGVGEADTRDYAWSQFIHPEDHEGYVNAYLEAVLRQDRFEAECRVRRHDGEYRWIHSTGVPRFESAEFKGYVGASVDIHDRKLAESVMAQMAAIVESSNDAIISKDLNGTITSWNKGAEKLFGYTAEEVIGKSIVILFPPDQLGEEAQLLERIKRGERVDHYETVRRHKYGHNIDISLTVSPIRDRAGKIIGASKIGRDISERKRIEAEREDMLRKESAARAEAEAANRGKDEFLAVVSHELRSPLNAILGYNRMMRERLPDEELMKRACDVIERNARTQLRLIEDLLDTARIASGKLTLAISKVDINPVIAEALDVVRPEAEAKGVRLRIVDCGLRIADSPIKEEDGAGREESAIRNPQSAIVFVDAGRLQQILWNLLSNAIRFTPAGGQVELRVERDGERIRIVVSDTGKGISPEFLPRVFDRFRQDDASSPHRDGGLGLGLALVKHLTELHGGKVEATSEGEGHGATFTVTLPLAKKTELIAEDPPALAASSALGNGITLGAGGIQAPAGLSIAGLRVLVVDDQEEACAALADFLNRRGALVTTASSGAEALAILSTSPDEARPDVLLCDIAMPGEDGYAALRRLRDLEEARGVAAAQRIPAIALTSLAGNEARLRALSAGFQIHIAKPVDPVELILVIANITGVGRRRDATSH